MQSLVKLTRKWDDAGQGKGWFLINDYVDSKLSIPFIRFQQ